MLGALEFQIESSAALDSADQRAGLILLGCMLLSFGFIRFSTRMIRAEVSWWPGNVTPGGLHIHHLVFGIVLMMLAGFISFAVQPSSPWFEIAAGVFGVGMGLSLDEFALWLYLDDVYWSEEGRSSVDAVVFAAIIGGGGDPRIRPAQCQRGLDHRDRFIGVDRAGHLHLRSLEGQDQRRGDRHVHPARRLGRGDPARSAGSWWARRRYQEGSEKLAEATKRKERHDRRIRRFQDLIGGAPSVPSTRAGGGAKPPEN